MSRYIDAEQLWKYTDNQKDKSISANDFMRFPYIDIVFCKECTYHFYDEPNGCKMCHIHEYGEIWNDDDYCSYGERKD